MDLMLQGKVVLITGAAGDIGAAIARAFAAEGAHLALLDRNGAGLFALASQVRDEGAMVSTATVDVSHPQEVQAGIKAVLTPHAGRVDVLVTAAGICPVSPIEQVLHPEALSLWREVYETNYCGTLLPIMEVLPIMQHQRSGVIIPIASDLARQPVPEMLPYSVSKASVVHLAYGLASHVGQWGIRVVVVAPGPTRTAIWTRPGGLMEFYAMEWNLSPEEALRRELRYRGMAIGRLVEPEEVAYHVVSVASPRAGAMTRTTFDINNGSHHGY